ncbi:Mut7-C RNAse domain-containing protein [Nonomuraea africana]|uniref:Mut7-C RNAse domain-containing protein n=1 Tax=Nonomuraea africana TaxID=46171 RepID=UPI00340D4B28
MEGPRLSIRFDADLWLFLTPQHRRESVPVAYDGTSTLGHVVESLGVPLPEVGRLAVDGRPVPPSHRPRDGDVVRVLPVRRPQELPVRPPRFLLDVHLGTLARRLRLLGVDTAYHNDRDDDALIRWANAERRLLLTRDRGLLRRRALWLGAYVRGSRADDQLADVLDRFAPPLAPWTRCTACNGELVPVAKADVEPLLEPGTRHNYDVFARCTACGHVYWRGAHSRRLEDIVAAAVRPVL